MLSGSVVGLALLLSVIGLYGIVSFAVICRTREIGIRIAVGAPSESILWLVMGNTARLVVIGVAAGLVAVWLGRQYIQSELFGMEGKAATSLGATALVLMSVALAAGLAPALRASRVDPLISLRKE